MISICISESQKLVEFDKAVHQQRVALLRKNQQGKIPAIPNQEIRLLNVPKSWTYPCLDVFVNKDTFFLSFLNSYGVC